MPGTWFFPPDFTFTTEGPLRLGMVIPHWSQPTIVLAAIDTDIASGVNLPQVKTIVEPHHAHNDSKSRSNSLSLWAKFETLRSASASTDDPLLPDAITAVSNLPIVRSHLETSLFFGMRNTYVVTGLRIATSSFTATKENSSNFGDEAEASGPPTGTFPAEIGAITKHDREKKVTNSYDTAPNIVFAYQLHVIRPPRAGLETELFRHKSAFLASEGGGEEVPLLLVEATKKEIDDDVELFDVEYQCEDIGEDELCVYVTPRIRK